MTIRSAEPRDAQAVADIYNFFVSTSIITFEEETVPASEMARRIEEVQSVDLPWLVAEDIGVLSGYAYAKPWLPRSAYRFSVEITVYVDPRRVRCGIGSMLYIGLFRAVGLWNMTASCPYVSGADPTIYAKGSGETAVCSLL